MKQDMVWDGLAVTSVGLFVGAPWHAAVICGLVAAFAAWQRRHA